MTDYSVPPTDEQIVAVFAASIKRQADRGVMLAKAVTEVTFADGVVTVRIDPVLAGEGVQYWALMETAAYVDNKAQTFDAPLAFDDEKGVWLRGRVTRIDAIDVDGRPLGTSTAEDAHRRGTGRG